MKQVYNIIVSIFFSLCAVGLTAQDIHFSQFYMSPLTLNPALTGVMNCNTRLIANYRNQWSAVLKNNAYNTYSVSYDQKVPVGRYDYFGFGGNLWGDVAGSLDFQTLTAKLSGSYSKRVGGSRKSAHYIVFGAQAGVSQRSIDFLKAQWPEQVGDDFNHNPGADPGEDLSRLDDGFLFADIGAGLLWFSTFDENNSLYVGAALEHLNQPNLSFYTDEEVTYFTKTVIHAGGEFQINRGLSLIPGIVTFMQGPSFEVNGGTSARFNLGGAGSGQSFQVGAWLRIANHFEDPITMDAVILSTRFDFRQYGIGFSYDSNVSSLREASPSNGAFEFSLIYNICGPQRRGVYCPRF